MKLRSFHFSSFRIHTRKYSRRTKMEREKGKSKTGSGPELRGIHFHRRFSLLLDEITNVGANMRPKRMVHKLFALTGHFQIGWRAPRHMDSSRIEPRFSSRNGNFISIGTRHRGDCQQNRNNNPFNPVTKLRSFSQSES